jgi:hypothetical protein
MLGGNWKPGYTLARAVAESRGSRWRRGRSGEPKRPESGRDGVRVYLTYHDASRAAGRGREAPRWFGHARPHQAAAPCDDTVVSPPVG